MAVGYQSFYQAQLTSPIDDTDLTIPVDVAPIPDEGYLVIESTVSSKREIIYYTSKTTNSVTCPADGRGYDGTTAVSHLSGAAVIMAPVGAMFTSLTDLFTTTPQGWTSLSPAVSSVTANGNRSYDVTFASDVSATLSEGMRLRTTRTVASTQNAFSLDGSNDYYNKTSPAGMTFTDDFVVSAWVKLTAYPSVLGMIASRWNGTSGWYLQITAAGVVSLVGTNAGGANFSSVGTYQSLPLNKWVHVTAQLDMSTFTATTTTSYIMFDGVNVPAVVARSGTNPTALIQAGNLEIGSTNGGLYPFPGYIDQVAIYSAKVTQATHLAAMHQGLTGSETSLISAYSNGSTTDLNTTNANNLTAQNGATTVASAPWGNRGLSSTLDYGLVMSVSGSTVTVQCPEGCTIPTSGGVSAVAYSTQANPYGWVSDKGRWAVESQSKTLQSQSSPTINVWYNVGQLQLNIPKGSWRVFYNGGIYVNRTSGSADISITLSTANNTESDILLTANAGCNPVTDVTAYVTREQYKVLASATQHYINIKTSASGVAAIYTRGEISPLIVASTPAGL